MVKQHMWGEHEIACQYPARQGIQWKCGPARRSACVSLPHSNHAQPRATFRFRQSCGGVWCVRHMSRQPMLEGRRSNLALEALLPVGRQFYGNTMWTLIYITWQNIHHGNATHFCMERLAKGARSLPLHQHRATQGCLHCPHLRDPERAASALVPSNFRLFCPMARPGPAGCPGSLSSAWSAAGPFRHDY